MELRLPEKRTAKILHPLRSPRDKVPPKGKHIAFAVTMRVLTGEARELAVKQDLGSQPERGPRRFPSESKVAKRSAHIVAANELPLYNPLLYVPFIKSSKAAHIFIFQGCSRGRLQVSTSQENTCCGNKQNI